MFHCFVSLLLFCIYFSSLTHFIQRSREPTVTLGPLACALYPRSLILCTRNMMNKFSTFCELNYTKRRLVVKCVNCNIKKKKRNHIKKKMLLRDRTSRKPGFKVA